MTSCLLAYDLGTSGLKATAIDVDGRVLASAGAGYATHTAAGGVAEQNPADWWQAVLAATALLHDRTRQKYCVDSSKMVK